MGVLQIPEKVRKVKFNSVLQVMSGLLLVLATPERRRY